MTQQNSSLLPQKTTTRTSIRRTHTIILTGDTLIALLRGKPHEVVSAIPPLDAEVTVMVPGGGDWSNATLDIDGDTPIQITWTDVEETLA